MQAACRENLARFRAHAGSMISFGAVDAQNERISAKLELGYPKPV
jgi:hypothetical protein